MSDGKLQIEAILAKYGFTEPTGHGTYKVPLEHTRCQATVYENFDETFEVEFGGTNIPSSRKYHTTRLSRKEDIAKLKTRARNAVNRVKKEEERLAKDHEVYLEEYKEIHQALVDRKVVFGLNISKEKYGSGAVFKVAGHNLQVKNTSCVVAIRIAGSTIRVPIEKAIEIATLIPKAEKEN